MELIERFKTELKNLSEDQVDEFFSGLEACNFVTGSAVEQEKRYSEIKDKSRAILVGKQVSVKTIIDSFVTHGFQHFIQTDRADYIYHLFASSLMIKKPKKFTNNPLPFFLRGVGSLEENMNRSVVATINAAKEKPKALNQIINVVQGNQKLKAYTNEVQLILDEMMINALYHGPAGMLDIDRERLDEVVLPAGNFIEVFVTFDEQHLLIGCKDSFGSIKREFLLEKLSRSFESERLDLPMFGSGRSLGLGLGCKMMIERSCSFFVSAIKGESTLVCCSFPLGVSRPKLLNLSKNIHMSYV